MGATQGSTGVSAPSWRRLARLSSLAVLVGLAFLIWVCLLDFPSYVAPGDSLDASWQQALGYFLTHGYQAGPDYVFTYGPLGYFYTSVYDADLFWWKYAWEVVVKLLMAGAFLAWAWQLRCFGLGAALCLLVVVFFPEIPNPYFLHRTDGMYGAFLLALGLLPLAAERPRLTTALAVAFVVAVLSLLKFNMAVQGALVLGVVSVNLLRGARPWYVVLPLLLAALVRIGVGVALGQGPAGLPAFLRGSVEIASGYVEAMAMPDDPHLLLLALEFFAVLLVVLASYGKSFLREGRTGLAAVLLVGTVFLTWKQGFVRHGLGPTPQFSLFLLVPFAFPLVFRTAGISWWRRGLLAAAFVLALIGRFGCEGTATAVEFLEQRYERFTATAARALHPSELQAHLEQDKNNLDRQYELASIRERVGNASIDEITCEQALLLRNGLNYRPRPVFQSYSAYTPYLLQRNADFYRSERGPEYVLLNLWTIDDRLPILDDGLALLEVLRNYYLAGGSGPYLLLKRAGGAGMPSPVRVEGQVRLDRTFRPGEEIALEATDPYQVMRLHIEYSWWGLARKLLYKPPPVVLRLLLEGGATQEYRLIPGMAEGGFLLNPFVTDTDGFRGLYTGAATARVRAFVLLVPEGADSFADEIRVSLEGYSELPCRRAETGP